MRTILLNSSISFVCNVEAKRFIRFSSAIYQILRPCEAPGRYMIAPRTQSKQNIIDYTGIIRLGETDHY
ncbi:hypothetical protein Tcan_01887 [Toxocara canis]|uniref:Uncharacterized protein n=1 Tax=Toxocara canis TaxID=6265 RepID=A0A0B2VS09_TOXCA|nr:hypothetical protein Tcan_01887 [Toxocara canis]